MSAGRFDRIEWSGTDVRVGDVVFDRDRRRVRPDELVARWPRLIKTSCWSRTAGRRHACRHRRSAADVRARASGRSPAICWSELLDPRSHRHRLDDRGDSDVCRSVRCRAIDRHVGVSQRIARPVALVRQHRRRRRSSWSCDDAVATVYEPTGEPRDVFPLLRAGVASISRALRHADHRRSRRPSTRGTSRHDRRSSSASG